MAGNLVPTNILDVANYVQQQGDIGRQQGLAQKFNRLAGQAYMAPEGDQRQALLGQAVGVDPKAGVALGNQLQLMDVDHNARLGGAARYMAQALQSKNPAQIDGAWQNVRGYLEKLTGKPTPDHWDPSMESGLYQAMAATGGTDGKKDLINVGAGGAVFDPATRRAIYQNPGVEKPANLQVVQIPDGNGGTIQGFANPRTGQIIPANYGMSAARQPAPARGSLTPIAEQANALLDQGMPPEDAVRQLLQARPDMQFQVKLDPQTGRFIDVSDDREQAPQGSQGMPATGAGLGYSPPKPNTADQESFGAPQQVMGTDGKPHLMQFGNRGGQREVQGFLKPDMTPAQAAKQAVQQQKAEASKTDAVESYDQSIGQIDQLLNSPGASMLGTFSGDIAGMIPHSDTANANAKLDVIKNQVLLNTISKLKALSATGASGFGSLSNQEGEILKNSIASLDKKQSNAQLMQNLRNIRSMLQQSRNRIAGQEVTFGQDGQQAPQSGQVEDGYRYRGGDPASPNSWEKI